MAKNKKVLGVSAKLQQNLKLNKRVLKSQCYDDLNYAVMNILCSKYGLKFGSCLYIDTVSNMAEVVYNARIQNEKGKFSNE